MDNKEHCTHEIVMRVIRIVSRRRKYPILQVKMSLINGSVGITKEFWDVIDSLGYTFRELNHCDGCDKFDLI